MYGKARAIYYGLSTFVLATALFVLYPSHNQELISFQKDIVSRFDVAFQQTMGDGPWFSEFADIYDGVNAFYAHSSNEMIAVLSSNPEADEDIAYVFSKVYLSFAKALPLQKSHSAPKNPYADVQLPSKPANFMTQEPVYNIIPYRSVVKTYEDGEVAGAVISRDEPVNTQQDPWVTLKDNLTGQLYCLAVYDGTVNKYIGPCKYDYH
jgi:hypothetical protein